MIFYLSNHISNCRKNSFTSIKRPKSLFKKEKSKEKERKKRIPKTQIYKDDFTVDQILNDLLREKFDNEENEEYRRKEAISNLPEFKYKYANRHMERVEKKCSICLNEFKEMERVKLFSCGMHLFHKDCIMKWLLDKDICPLCKKPIIY